MEVNFKLVLNFKKPFPLSELKDHRKNLLTPGVYLLIESDSPLSQVEVTSSQVIYIGKAAKNGIYSRLTKHLSTIVDERSSKGVPKTNPGKKFREYRASINYDAKLIWVVPVSIEGSYDYLFSLAEEYLLHLFKTANGRLPLANTADIKGKSQSTSKEAA